MKNQYFGDIRDLFKYDVIHHIIKEVESVKRFTFVPMLTEDDNGRDGNKVDYSKAVAGIRNTDLSYLLQTCVREKRRNVSEIERYFAANGVRTAIHKGGSEYFTHGGRSGYFASLEDTLLHDALVFLDPDNGLEVKGSNHKHVLFSEIKDLYRRMNENSILMAYQHFPREGHDGYLTRRSAELKDVTGDLPMYVSDNEIVFFFLTKDEGLKSKLVESLIKYKTLYHSLLIGNVSLKWV